MQNRSQDALKCDFAKTRNVLILVVINVGKEDHEMNQKLDELGKSEIYNKNRITPLS